MTDVDEDLPQARVELKRGVSIVWLLPIIAALAAAWLVWDSYSQRGPTITIAFTRGDGIETGKTTLRYKAVEVGKVIAVHITKDLRSVVATARIHKEFAGTLRVGTRFWVVRPRVGTSGVSGLGTLVSGAYIEIDPGEGAPHYAFKGLAVPPIVAADVPGERYILESDTLGSIQAGSAVFFRDIQVGEVLGYQLAEDGSAVTIYIFVRDPYTQLVREGTLFSNASGINVSINSDGIDLRTGSVQTLLLGGITFDLPLGSRGDPAPPGAKFWLYDSLENINDSRYSEQVPFILYFDDSVRGLSVGAPVEFKGIKLGTVSQIDLEVDERNSDIRIPVTIALQPQRLLTNEVDQVQQPNAIIESLIERGLRARLQTGNLLTGQMFVELGLYPGTPKVMVTGRRALPQIPTIPSEFVEVKQSATELLDKLRRLPLEAIGERALGAVSELEALLKSPALRSVAATANTTLVSVRQLSDDLNAELKPLALQLQNTLGGVDTNSAVYAQLAATLKQIDDAARAVRTLADSVERQPSALIWGKKVQQPKSGAAER